MPIDACYELVGEMRRLWKGFGGGTEANDAMDAFFDPAPGTSRGVTTVSDWDPR